MIQSLFRNRWFWVFILAVLNLSIVGMTISMPYSNMREALGSQNSVVRATPTISTPTPSPTMSPADTRGKVLGESRFVR